MKTHPSVFSLSLISIVSIISFGALAACGPSATAAPPDAPPDASTVPKSPAGTFSVASTLDLDILPPPASALLDELDDATDSPDDPARFLCDRIVAALPAEWQSIASGVADVMAPYLESELDSFAPSFGPGIRALAAGLADVMHHAQLHETLAIEPTYFATRTVTGIQFASSELDFASEGIADAIANTTVALDAGGELQIAQHQLVLPYGKLVRIGFDRGVVPNVDLDAHSRPRSATSSTAPSSASCSRRRSARAAPRCTRPRASPR